QRWPRPAGAASLASSPRTAQDVLVVRSARKRGVCAPSDKGDDAMSHRDETLPQGPRRDEPAGLEALLTFLSESKAECQGGPHEPPLPARAEARVSQVAPEQAAKTVVLRVGDGYRLA